MQAHDRDRTPLVYLAGPYRAPTPWEVDQNIQRARLWGAQVLGQGCYPVVPHANTAHCEGLAPDRLFLDGTLELARRCDAVLMIPGWETSEGARAEHEMARRTSMPILLGMEDLGRWLVVWRGCGRAGEAPVQRGRGDGALELWLAGERYCELRQDGTMWERPDPACAGRMVHTSLANQDAVLCRWVERLDQRARERALQACEQLVSEGALRHATRAWVTRLWRALAGAGAS